jgi:hypothetical protein
MKKNNKQPKEVSHFEFDENGDNVIVTENREQNSKHTPGEQFELRFSQRNGYYFIDEQIGGEGHTVLRFHPETSEQEAEKICALLEENKQLKQQVQDYAQIINDGEADKREQGWMQFLAPIINEYKEGSDEPLDGDEVERLTEIIRAKINLNEGNITEEECEEILNNSK